MARGLTLTEARLLRLLAALDRPGFPALTTRQLADRNGLTTPNAYRLLARLERSGQVRSFGPAAGGLTWRRR